MKKIIALMLIVCSIVCSALLFNSCDILGGGDGGGGDVNNNGGTGDTGNGGNNGDNGGTTDDDYVPDCDAGDHLDKDNNDYCDLCNEYVIVVIDFYVLNDLHGKFCDTDTQPGVDELGTYFKLMAESDDNIVILSSGDMWQGTAESNLTHGLIITEWMNEMGFVSMTLGNHEFDWGEGYIKANSEAADFPFLAINIYDRATNKPVDYCEPSVMIERDGLKIGIIGAIGDCYSSISSDMVEGVYFKVGSELTSLVKAESDRLREAGADLIVYSLHDGYGSSKNGSSMIGSSAISAYYDSILSSGYVDLVFEGHSHQRYTLIDPSGVYHLQGGGENYGLSHVEIAVNSANGANKVNDAGVVANGAYKSLQDDEATEALENKYSDIIDYAYAPLGVVSKELSDNAVEDYVASFYLKAGMAKWGEKYDIVLGGGFLRTRSPYDLAAGTVTYADILSLLPFDNRIVLCSISGYNLKNRFIYNDSSDYHTALSDYGNSLYDISNSETYYVIVDSYTALYARNGLTIVDFYDDSTYARDLFADAVAEGMFEVKHDSFTITPLEEVIEVGEGLANNRESEEYFYVKGTVITDPNSTYGNLYIEDNNGDQIYVYGLYDTSGARYDSMRYPPREGDTVTLYSTVFKYYNNSTGEVTIELKNATLIDIE